MSKLDKYICEFKKYVPSICLNRTFYFDESNNIKKGIIYFLVAFVSLAIIGNFFVDSILNSFYYIIDILISIYAAYDAYLIAKD